MFWILLTAFLLIVSVVFTVLFKVAENKMNWEHEFIVEMIVSWLINGLVLLITIIMLPCEYCTDKQFVETFERQKYYIEEIAPTLSQTDNYAITQSRIELNQKLYDLQYSCEHYSFFFFYPEGIMELEPIK